MANFTIEESNATTVTIARKLTNADESHNHWIFGVSDGDNNQYVWRDKTLGGSATEAEQKQVICDYLCTIEKKGAAPAQSTMSNSSIVGGTVG